jgi:hypothetical protein
MWSFGRSSAKQQCSSDWQTAHMRIQSDKKKIQTFTMLAPIQVLLSLLLVMLLYAAPASSFGSCSFKVGPTW